MFNCYYVCYLTTGWNSRRFSRPLRDFLQYCRDNVGKRGNYKDWPDAEENWFFVTGTYGYYNGQIMAWEWKFIFKHKSDVAKVVIQYADKIRYQEVAMPLGLAKPAQA